jgi:hypothetical protein
MENVKHHVDKSGNTTVRGFFSSDSVDFDPASPSLRQNIKKAKAKIVYDLASGFTPESEEREIRDIMKGSENSYELIRMVGAIDGWEGLDSELEYSHVDEVASQLAQVLDQRDYVVYQLIRRYLVLLDYNASPNLGDCFQHVLQWPIEFQKAEIDHQLNRKGDLLRTITSAAMRDRTNMINAARVFPAVITQYLTTVPAPHLAIKMAAMMHEANYTTRICASLVRLDYFPLYSVVTDMVDPSKTNLERIACKDTFLRLSLEAAAAAKAVEVAGSNEAKATVNRFMSVLKVALDNFSPTLPAPSALGAIIAALGGIGNTLSALQTAITNLPDALAGAITLAGFLDSDSDDKARQLISELNAQGSLAHLAFTIKVKLVNAMLSGSTGDDDEIAILSVMQKAKAYDQAELYQLAAAATWDALYSSVDGDEYDELLSTLQQPT